MSRSSARATGSSRRHVLAAIGLATILVGSSWATAPAHADNDKIYEDAALRSVAESQPGVAPSPNRKRQPLFDVTAVAVAFIGAFVGSILVFGWQDKWFAGAAAKASAGAIADQRVLTPRPVLARA